MPLSEYDRQVLSKIKAEAQADANDRRMLPITDKVHMVHEGSREVLGPVQCHTAQALGVKGSRTNTWIIDKLLEAEDITDDEHLAARHITFGWMCRTGGARIKTASFNEVRYGDSADSETAYRTMMAERFDLWRQMMLSNSAARWLDAAQDVITDLRTMVDSSRAYRADNRTVKRAVVFGLGLYAWTHFRGDKPEW